MVQKLKIPFKQCPQSVRHKGRRERLSILEPPQKLDFNIRTVSYILIAPFGHTVVLFL